MNPTAEEHTLESDVQCAAAAQPASVHALRRLRKRLVGGDGDSAARREAAQRAALRQPRSRALWLLLALARIDAGEDGPALQCWQQALRAPPGARDDDMLAALDVRSVDGWKALAARFQACKAERLRASYGALRAEYGARALFRIERAVAGYLGEATVVSPHPTQQPKVMYVPGLSGHGFIDPQRHPLVEPLMASFDAIQSEFDEALAEGQGIVPFLGEGNDQARRLAVSGSASASWDALFFYRHGQRFEETHRRFPRTGALLDSLDLCRIDHQAPEICFSILRPHTRIEPHHGVTNARSVVHVPLRAPQGSFLEVVDIGRHYWREGCPMVFDDSFLHAAENPTDKVRGILLMDSWHPDLTEPERRAFRAIIETITAIESLPVLG